jgi:ribosomal protein S1
MGWSRVSDPSQVVAPGMDITVKVLRVDDETQKIALGLKQLSADPWATVQSRYEAGQVRTGRVVRLAEFGAFVELEPGIEGLAHASTFAPSGHSKGWTRSVPVGMAAAFEILSIDLEKKRIALAPVEQGSTREAGAVPSTAATDSPDVEEVTEHAGGEDAAPAEAFGSLADKLRGALKRRNK